MLIETKFIGPTNTKGSRIKVTRPSSKQSKIYEWDYSLDSEENHKKAFRLFLNSQYKSGLMEVKQFSYCESQSGKGLVFVSHDYHYLTTTREENNFQLESK